MASDRGRDMDEKKSYMGALQNANKKLDLLSSITGHDIGNQLLSLQGNLSLFTTKHPELAHDST